MNKICVYAICKNESKFVDRGVDSMQEADAIVVLDTGSTDDTVEKLRARGVKVEQKIIKPWRFDVARNESLKMVPEDCNILVCTDLDEVIHPGGAEILKNSWIEGKHTRAGYKYIWSHLENNKPGRIFGADKIHNRNGFWRYPVHELLFQYKNNNEDSEELILNENFIIEHFADPNKSRGSYLPLLEVRVEENPDELTGLIYLSHEYYYRGQYENSIKMLNRCLASPDITGDKMLTASCYLFMGDDYVSLDKLDDAIQAYKKGIEAAPFYREPYLNLASTYITLKQYREAVYYVNQGLKNSIRQFSWLERDTSGTYQPYDLLCIAYYYLGDKFKALACGYRAAEGETADGRLRDNIKAILDNIDINEG